MLLLFIKKIKGSCWHDVGVSVAQKVQKLGITTYLHSQGASNVTFDYKYHKPLKSIVFWGGINISPSLKLYFPIFSILNNSVHLILVLRLRGYSKTYLEKYINKCLNLNNYKDLPKMG